MKSNKFLLGLFLMVVLCHCRAKKITETATKTITIECSEMYCGGAAPQAEIVNEMSKLKPLAEKEIEVFAGNPAYVTPHIFKSNSKGEIIIPVNIADKVFINIYPSAEGFKSDSEEYECYKKFIAEHLFTIDMTSPEKEFKFTTVILCNPCIPAAP